MERGKPFKIRKASTDHWYDIAIGTSVGHVALNLVNKEGCVVVELYIMMIRNYMILWNRKRKK